MKTSLSLFLALVALTSARAEIFRSEAANSPARSAGHSSRGGGDGRRDNTTVHVGVNYGAGNRGYDYGRGYYGHSRYYDRNYRGGYAYVPSYGYYSGYGYGYPYYGSYGYYGSGSAAANGLLLGALAGGIIGHNSGDFRHNGWRGAAWGAGAGWLLGSVIDANRRAVYDSAPVVVQQAPVAQVQTQQSAPAQPQQVTIINNYYNATPMSGVNGMFGR